MNMLEGKIEPACLFAADVQTWWRYYASRELGRLDCIVQAYIHLIVKLKTIAMQKILKLKD